MSPQQVAELPNADSEPSLPPLALEVRMLKLAVESVERIIGWYTELYGPSLTQMLVQRALQWRRDPVHGELSPALQMLAREASE